VSAALLDHLWQSSLFAAGIALLMPLFRRQGAGLRFWLWFAASMKFLLPFSGLVALGRLVMPHVASSLTSPVLTIIRPASLSIARVAPLVMPAPARIPAAELGLIVWAVGLVAIGLIFMARWLELRAALRAASPVALAVPLPVKSAPSFYEPGLVGIWRPVILLPRGLPQQLTPAELDAILAHELCHLRRRDNLLAALHMLVEGLFWFHPLVWWIGRRLVEERERACDEAVVAAGIRPRIYAEGILKTCRFYVQTPLACASGVSGADLKLRLGAIMAERPVAELHPAQGMLLALAAAATVMLPLTAGLLGSAPVSSLAIRAARVLAVPQRMARQLVEQQRDASIVLPPALSLRPAATAYHLHLARSQPAAPGASQQEAVMQVHMPRMLITILLDTHPPTLPDNDPIACRKPQQLADSHMAGPQICLRQSQWAQLQAKKEDVTPDGLALFRTDYDQQLDGRLCPGGLPGATSGTALAPPSLTCIR
jgi:beta-lactamase regulating signal transducer with metallopeptidase domain